jgi:hypothetical protein
MGHELEPDMRTIEHYLSQLIILLETQNVSIYLINHLKTIELMYFQLIVKLIYSTTVNQNEQTIKT